MVHQTEITEAEQELLEQLWQHQEEGAALDPSARSQVTDLGFSERGWVSADGAALTPVGLDLARRAIRRHRLAERLLADLMGERQENAEEDACRLEHSLVEGLAEKVCTFLGHPRVCPHGNRIPEGPCCRAARSSVDPVVAPLHALKAGESGVIAYLATPHGEDLQKFLSMGIHPGDGIQLVRKTPSIVFRSGESQFAVDRDLASQVYVRRL
ncbi:MAG: metal-dependent transcriptional regulator [Acidobacteriota bacterium]